MSVHERNPNAARTTFFSAAPLCELLVESSHEDIKRVFVDSVAKSLFVSTLPHVDVAPGTGCRNAQISWNCKTWDRWT